MKQIKFYGRFEIYIVDIHVGGVLLESDVHLRGHVTWVGRTSMEITMRAEQVQVISTTVEYHGIVDAIPC